jgi:hypothetical protein
MLFFMSSITKQRIYCSGLKMYTVRISETSVNITRLHDITSQERVLLTITAVRAHTQKTECREQSKPDQCNRVHDIFHVINQHAQYYHNIR